MKIGDRIGARLISLGISQAELARRVGVSQPTIAHLVRGRSNGSSYLHRIARELETTPAYLTGEVADPDADAPPAPRYLAPQTILLPVTLPPEYVLTDMYRGLLASMPDLHGDALARELARLLPTALASLKGPFRYEASDDDDAETVSPEALPDAVPRRRRA